VLVFIIVFPHAGRVFERLLHLLVAGLHVLGDRVPDVLSLVLNLLCEGSRVLGGMSLLGLPSLVKWILVRSNLTFKVLMLLVLVVHGAFIVRRLLSLVGTANLSGFVLA